MDEALAQAKNTEEKFQCIRVFCWGYMKRTDCLAAEPAHRPAIEWKCNKADVTLLARRGQLGEGDWDDVLDALDATTKKMRF